MLKKRVKGAIRKEGLKERLEELSKKEEVFYDTNEVFINGRIEAELEYSHKVREKNFYRTRVRVKRLSGTEDLVPIVVSDLQIGRERMKTSFKDKWIEVTGQFRSYNRRDKDGKRHLDLFLFATAITIYDNKEELGKVVNENWIHLDGYLCKKPIYRKTPSGREITDFLIAVNRPYGKADYIPCIAWGRIARWASGLEVGNRVELCGRIQSRKYFKRFSEDSEEGEHRIAYEISAVRMWKVEDLRLEE